MTNAELQSFYGKRKIKYAEQLYQANKKINLISNTRIGVALIFLAATYFGFSNFTLLYSLPLLLIIFILLIRKHGSLFDEKTHLENLVKIHNNEIQALKGDSSCYDTGIEFNDPHHPYSHDLDIFGDGSLFQFLNRSNSLSGKSKIANELLHPLSSASEIETRQEAIKELAAKTDFRHHIQAAGMEMDEQPHDRKQLLNWLYQPTFLYNNSFYKYFLIIFPTITVALVVGAFFFVQLKYFAILFALIQWAFLGFHLKDVNAFHDYISRKKNILQKYARVLQYIQPEKFSSPLLKTLAENADEADKKVQSLASLVSALDARLNSMTNLITNSLLLYDLQCIYRLEKWKETNAAKLNIWLDVITEIEMLCSYGTFAFNHVNFNYAKIESSLTISATALGHPLIEKEECVTNNVVMGREQSVLIITGANMAGKSTFLRTLGINLVLALNGAPVCAEEFKCPVINLRTGMRTADSLKDHQSYFYAELNRLKTIMEELRSDKPLLILLDEILKGTNSTDKQAGSIALVKQLLPHPCLAIIATHDLALGELETAYPEKVRNYCFEANIENEQLSFDYKLKRGMATKMNATFLMKKMGIIPQ
jgi:hypothetical protein